jgi:hypothetical protein
MKAGKCVAQGLTILRVFESLEEAISKLDYASDLILVKRRSQHGSEYPEGKVRIKGEEWCSEAVKTAV